MKGLHVRHLQAGDPEPMARAFGVLGGSKTVEQYVRYLAEQEAGSRVCFVAELDGVLAGYCTLLWVSGYEPFRSAGVPEVNDLNVLPAYRNRGIGNALLDAVEQSACRRSPVVGLGVGLHAGYGAAQRIYARRGYVPDGRGVMYANEPVAPGSTIRIDDAATLMFTRPLPRTPVAAGRRP